MRQEPSPRSLFPEQVRKVNEEEERVKMNETSFSRRTVFGAPLFVFDSRTDVCCRQKGATWVQYVCVCSKLPEDM